jgi:FSR family fosmidomycin resistance protein-like MFS transporter
MARWTLAGAVGVVLGALALALSVAVGAGWRGLFLGLLAATTAVLLMARRAPFGTTAAVDESARRPDLKDGVARAWRALRDRSILRWLVLYEFSDLMLDGLHGYIALYFVDVAKTSAAYAATAVAVAAGADLLGTLLLIPLLERVKGVSYLKISALVALVLYAGFLLVPSPPMKLAALALLGVALAGWYSVLKAQVYSSMPGWSGTALTIQNVSGFFGSLIPLGIGLAASQWGLGTAMWLLLAGPIALLIGLRSVEDRPTRSPVS